MKLYDLGAIPWKRTQLIYHALARAGEESFVICSPMGKYACVGFHQVIPYELDLDFCQEQDIGLFRREIGGGTVLLDNDQLFYQMIINRERTSLDQRVLFRKYLEPVIRTYRALGIEAEYNPVSDIVVHGKKISGNGGGDIGKCKVVTGSILLDFDSETMCRILNLPSESFRERVCSAMKANLTTVKDELGIIPNVKEVTSLLVDNWQELFGKLEAGALDQETNGLIQSLDTMFSSDEWLYKKRKQKGGRDVKIKEGFNLIYDVHRGFEMCIEVRDEKIWDLMVYGDLPEDKKSLLNRKLEGKQYSADSVLETLGNIL